MALHRYREVLQALHDRNIRPVVSLHHFSHPEWFEHEGGFLNPRAPELFEQFVGRAVEGLSDLCRLWITLNEPNVYTSFGYVLGEFPPGRKGQTVAALRALKTMAHAHARAYRRIHALQPEAEVGWAQHYAVLKPARHNSRLDRLAAGTLDRVFNQTFFDAVEHGDFGFPLSVFDGNLGHVKGTCDFVGLNVYSRFNVAFRPRLARQLFADVFVPEDVPQGDRCAEKPYGEAHPEAIRAAVVRA